jgi:hypothetical protein
MHATRAGASAAEGLAQFGRQALVGGSYGLLREGSFEPNPGADVGGGQ